MKYKIVNPQSSLDKVIFGVEPNVQRRNYDTALEKVKENIDVSFEVSRTLSFPEIYRNDVLIHQGSFPDVNLIQDLFEINLDISKFEQTDSLLDAANQNRVGICCGVGSNIYLDPYEEN